MAKRKMFNKGLISAGLIVFVVVATSPFWLNFGNAEAPPEVVLTAKAKAAGSCVRSLDYMKRYHMQLLNTWRTSVVRDGNTVYVNSEGKSYTMSLTKTCLDCHSNKAEFCDRCHNYASITPYCFDCHIENPKETQ